jgi:hypothetical protein
MNHNKNIKMNDQDSYQYSTNSLSQKAFHVSNSKLSYEENIARFIQSKYTAFDFVSDFETNCLNIIKSDTIGFEDIEKLNDSYKKERDINKDETDNDYILHKQSTKLSMHKTDTITVSDNIYEDSLLSQAKDFARNL